MTIEVVEPEEGDLGEVIITRDVSATPDVIFDAFMDPGQLVHFWGPVGCHTPIDRVVIEPRAGGRFESVMVADDGSGEFPVRATFLRVDAPKVWSWQEESGLITTSTLTDLGDGRTRMVIHQTNVPPPYRTPDALAGFSTALDKLDAYLATKS